MNRNAFSIAIGILTLSICWVGLRAGLELAFVMAAGMTIAFWLAQPAPPRANESKVDTLGKSGQ